MCVVPAHAGVILIDAGHGGRDSVVPAHAGVILKSLQSLHKTLCSSRTRGGDSWILQDKLIDAYFLYLCNWRHYKRKKS